MHELFRKILLLTVLAPEYSNYWTKHLQTKPLYELLYSYDIQLEHTCVNKCYNNTAY